MVDLTDPYYRDILFAICNKLDLKNLCRLRVNKYFTSFINEKFQNKIYMWFFSKKWFFHRDFMKKTNLNCMKFFPPFDIKIGSKKITFIEYSDVKKYEKEREENEREESERRIKDILLREKEKPLYIYTIIKSVVSLNELYLDLDEKGELQLNKNNDNICAWANEPSRKIVIDIATKIILIRVSEPTWLIKGEINRETMSIRPIKINVINVLKLNDANLKDLNNF